MTQPLRIYRLWRTSGILCALGALEFGYVAYIRQTWWFLGVSVALILVTGLALKKARTARNTSAP